MLFFDDGGEESTAARPVSGRSAGVMKEGGRAKPVVVEKVEFQPLPSVSAAPLNNGIKPVFHGVMLNLQAELGKAGLNIRELLKLEEGSVLKLNRMTDENITILVNETPFAYGEVVVINEHFGIRITAFAGDDTTDKKPGAPAEGE